MLTISEYCANETTGRAYVSNSFLRAFCPVTYRAGGFPTDVTEEREIVRYIDSQHAGCFEFYFNVLLGNGTTRAEYEKIVLLTRRLHGYTHRSFGRDFLVKAPVLAALACVRAIEAAVGENQAPRIFEFGAGSGVLGCLSSLYGYRYCATDVTQAFYLLQNRLLSLFDEQLVELADMREYDSTASTMHIPYWKLWTLRNEITDIDIFTCNHALLEMSKNAVSFFLQLGRNAMKNSQHRLFIFQGTGWNTMQDIGELLELFAKYGYHMCYFSPSTDLGILTLNETEHVGTETVKSLIRARMCGAGGKSDGGKILVPQTFGNIRSGLDIMRASKSDAVYADPLGARINEYYLALDSMDMISMETLVSAYHDISQKEASPDDEFRKYLDFI